MFIALSLVTSKKSSKNYNAHFYCRCPHYTDIGKKGCFTGSSLFQQKCHCKSGCKIEAYGAVFGDSCENPLNYVNVTYLCVSDDSKYPKCGINWYLIKFLFAQQRAKKAFSFQLSILHYLLTSYHDQDRRQRRNLTHFKSIYQYMLTTQK